MDTYEGLSILIQFGIFMVGFITLVIELIDKLRKK